VSCLRPAAVSARHVIGQMIPGIILFTLAQAMPEDVMAESAGSVWGLTVQGHKGGTPYAGYMMTSGGMGARPTKDGLSATQFPTGSRFLPIEIAELESPVRYKCRELITDSGGPGRFRGGLGQKVHIEVDPDGSPCLVNVIAERVKHPARGLAGGRAGRPGFVGRTDGSDLAAKSRTILTGPVTFTMETPGGGGFGSPMERDPASVKVDVDLGYVSAARAAEIYGVALNGLGEVDVTATAHLRRKSPKNA
jgi:N-methylhydantoinase B/oxoprolinase/acetone carboxylase alpha subunit